ncbi:MAG: hypothetical protein NVSMB31_07550 [Vulcanimicrobiaceae bacterium]
MGQKIHPVGLRLGITRTWDSRWFEKKHYQDWLHEDVAIRKYFVRWMRPAAISRIEIERRANQARVIINTGKPGIIIGKRGVGIEEIRKNLEKLTGKSIQVNVVEIKHIELDARLVGQNIVDQLEKRIAFRRAMKQSIMRSMKAGAKGIRVQVSGRLGGAEIARTERNHDGKVPLHTLRADIDYAHVEAFTTFGRIGVKVWIYRGEVLPDQPRNEQVRPAVAGDRPPAERATFRDRRDRGGRGGARGRAPGAAQPANASASTTDDIATSPSDTQEAPQAGDVLNAAQHEVALGAALETQQQHQEQLDVQHQVAEPAEAHVHTPPVDADKTNVTESPSTLEADPTSNPDTKPTPAPESAQPAETSPQGDPQVSEPTTESAE